MRISLVSLGLSFSLSFLLVSNILGSQGYIRLDKEFIILEGSVVALLWLSLYLSLKRIFK